VDSTAILHTAIKQLNGAENKRASRLSDSSCHLCFAVIGIWTYKILWSINISISQRFYIHTTVILGPANVQPVLIPIVNVPKNCSFTFILT